MPSSPEGPEVGCTAEQSQGPGVKSKTGAFPTSQLSSLQSPWTSESTLLPARVLSWVFSCITGRVTHSSFLEGNLPLSAHSCACSQDDNKDKPTMGDSQSQAFQESKSLEVSQPATQGLVRTQGTKRRGCAGQP